MMRLWSLHPRHLDRAGLLACWREALLAQAVLRGKTRGYRNHSQLTRFRLHDDPRAAIATYLAAIADEATARGYTFDRRKIGRKRTTHKIPLTIGQLAYEWTHLQTKLTVRAPDVFARNTARGRTEIHPLFQLFPGPIAAWEKQKN